MRNFQYSCIECPNVEELHYIIDNSEAFTYRTLRRNVKGKGFIIFVGLLLNMYFIDFIILTGVE